MGGFCPILLKVSNDVGEHDTGISVSCQPGHDRSGSRKEMTRMGYSLEMVPSVPLRHSGTNAVFGHSNITAFVALETHYTQEMDRWLFSRRTKTRC